MAQDVLANGFVQLCIDPSLNFFDGKCRAVFIGQALDPGDGSEFVEGEVQTISSDRDLIPLFGQGSILTEALRVAMCGCPDNVQFFALPLPDPAAGVAAVYEMTITGPATSAGRFTLFMGNGFGETNYNIDVPVDVGDTVADIVAAVIAAVSPNFTYAATPITTGVAPDLVTTGVRFTAKNKGTIGNYLNPVYNWAGRKNYAPAGVTVTTARTTVGAGDPDAVDLISIFDECCYSCISVLSDGVAIQKSATDYLNDAWSCDKPQCFGEGFTFNSGTLGQVLAKGDNSLLQRVAFSLESTEFPWAVVANYAALTCCTACNSPEISIQGPDFGVLSCVAFPQSCGSPWSTDERVQLRDAGFVTYGPASFGTGELVNPQIFNDVTNRLYDNLGRPNATFRAASSLRLQQTTALAVAEQLNNYNGLALFTKNTKINQGVKGTTIRLMTADLITWAKSQIGILFSEFDDVSKDVVIQSDTDVKPRCQGDPETLHCNFRYRQPNRIGKIITNLQPQLFDNCAR